MKKCTKCNIEKELSDFTKDKANKCGLKSRCKSCVKEYQKANADKIKEQSKEYQKANANKIKKRRKEHYKANSDKIKEQSKEYQKANADKIKEHKKKYYKANADKIKEYQKANADKIKEHKKEYYKANADKIKEYRKVNADKIKKRRKEHYKANSDKIKEQSKEYQKANADKIKEHKKKYYKANADKIKEQCVEYNKERRKIDPLFKFTHNTRCLIRDSFKRGINNFTKSKRTEEILGCSIPFFCNYIKGQFTKGMSLENYGEWHLDHINPVSTATTEEEVIELNHYTNFQPLWAVDNLSKNNKLVEKQLKLL